MGKRLGESSDCDADLRSEGEGKKEGRREETDEGLRLHCNSKKILAMPKMSPQAKVAGQRSSMSCRNMPTLVFLPPLVTGCEQTMGYIILL